MRLSKDEYINELNNSINSLKDQVDYVKLSTEYSEMSFEDASRNLIFHRMFKNFEQPDEDRQKNVQTSSVHSVFHFDENQGYSESRFTQLPEVVRKDMYDLRLKMQEDCRRAKAKYTCSITTGENVISRQGDTSVFSKLSHIEAWTCSPSNFQKAFKIIAKTRLLRRMLVKHYDDLLWKQYVRIRSLLTIEQILGLPRWHWKQYLKKHYRFLFKKYGTDVLVHMARKVITFIDMARITTVPKDNEAARVIITCPLFDMISQRDDAATITEILRSNYGLILSFTQNIQRNRIYDYENATVDFSNASNSTKLDSVKFLLGNTQLFRKHLNVSRIATCQYRDTFHQLTMFSPMGCGSTFELMTWILTAAARLFDENATVFGDDVVIKRSCVPRFLALTAALGYNINVTKTFVEGTFRESCGAFISHGRNIKSFQFEWAADYYDAVILTNKLRLVRHGIPELEELYHRLVTLVPLLTFKMAPDDHPVLDDGIPSSENLIRKQKKCVATTSLFKRALSKNTYATRSSRITQYYVREILIKKCVTLWDEPYIDDVPLPVYASYMYNMRCEAPVIRNTEHTQSQTVLCEINNNLPVTFQD